MGEARRDVREIPAGEAINLNRRRRSVAAHPGGDVDLVALGVRQRPPGGRVLVAHESAARLDRGGDTPSAWSCGTKMSTWMKLRWRRGASICWNQTDGHRAWGSASSSPIWRYPEDGAPGQHVLGDDGVDREIDILDGGRVGLDAEPLVRPPRSPRELHVALGQSEYVVREQPDGDAPVPQVDVRVMVRRVSRPIASTVLRPSRERALRPDPRAPPHRRARASHRHPPPSWNCLRVSHVPTHSLARAGDRGLLAMYPLGGSGPPLALRPVRRNARRGLGHLRSHGRVSRPPGRDRGPIATRARWTRAPRIIARQHVRDGPDVVIRRIFAPIDVGNVPDAPCEPRAVTMGSLVPRLRVQHVHAGDAPWTCSTRIPLVGGRTAPRDRSDWKTSFARTPGRPDRPPAGRNSSIGLPDGSSRRICLPQGR